MRGHGETCMNETVAASWTNGIHKLALEMGIPERELAGAVGVLKDCRPEGRSSYARHLRLWEAISESSSPGMGIRMAESCDESSALDLMWYLLRSCASVQEAADRLARYGRLINENSRQEFRFEKGVLVFEDGPIRGTAWPRAYAEHTLALVVCTFMSWTGTFQRPLLATFTHPRPASIADYERVFRCPLQFDSTTLSLRFPRSVGDAPFAQGERCLLEHLERRADELLRTLPAPSLRGKVVGILGVLLEKDPNLHTVARKLFVSQRTLQRQLAEQGVSFRQLLDEARREEAVRLLSSTSLSIDECSDKCGFSHTSAFRRASLRWLGVSPNRYRRGNAIAL